MVSIRPAATTVFAVALCSGAAAEEFDTIEVAFPANHTAYLTTSDVVVTGRSKSFGLAGTIKILSVGSAEHAKASFQVATREQNGNWVCWNASPQHRGWRLAARRVQITIDGQRAEVPITFVADPVGTGVPIPIPTTAVDSDEYEKLPAIKFGMTTLSDSGSDLPKMLDQANRDGREIVLNGEDEFAVEGTFRIQKLRDALAFGIIFRLTDVRAGEHVEDKNVIIVGESFVLAEPTDDREVYRYRTVVRAPNRPGRLTLEAIYRQRVIASSPIEVRQAPAIVAGAGWVVEYPLADAVYAQTSEIVVAGRGGVPAPMSFVVELHDKKDVTHNSFSGATGGQIEDGAWSGRLPLPGRSVWPAGEYQIDVCPVYGRQNSLPIKVIADAVVPAAPLGTQTTIGSEDYATLPCLRLADVQLSTPDSATPTVSARKKTAASDFRIYSGQEFSCECTLTFQDAGRLVPFEVILRLTETTARDGQKPGDPRVTVGEAIAKFQLAVQEGLYPFRSVLRAPNRPGKLKLDAIYRKTVIASATIEVVSPAKN